MTQGPDTQAFEEFQRGIFRLALVLWSVALAATLVIYREFSPLLGGVVLGGAASLGAFAYKVRLLRRLAAEPTAQAANRLPLLDAGRYLIFLAGLVPAALLAWRYDMQYLYAAAAALPLANVATIIQAVRTAKPAKSA